MFSSVTLRVAQRFAKRHGLKSSFKRLDKAPTKLFEQVLEVAKVAFDRLKRKDLSYFELDNEDVSPEAVQLGFLEHVQATSSAKADQYGFRHLTVQEYLAALYASTVVLKKAEDVAALVAQLGCGTEAGHLNTFWGVCCRTAGERPLRGAVLCHRRNRHANRDRKCTVQCTCAKREEKGRPS